MKTRLLKSSKIEIIPQVKKKMILYKLVGKEGFNDRNSSTECLTDSDLE